MCRVYLFLASCIYLIGITLTHAAEPKRNWTFLIFINGKNNLSNMAIADIKEMEAVGSNDQVNVVEWGDRTTGKTVRMLIKKSTNPNSITSPVLQDLGAVDMGNYENLNDFIEWGVRNFPADKYFIDVWDHGNGWHISHPSKLDAPDDISYDDLTRNFIKTEQLGQSMARAAQLIGHRVDIYGSDACQMGMVEVADEMADSVRYFVGSEEDEPGPGWPYQALLATWQAIPDATPEQVAKILVSVYVTSYQTGTRRSEVTMSAFDLLRLMPLDRAISDLANNIAQLNPTSRSQVLTIARNARRFHNVDYADLIDFLRSLLSARIPGVNPQLVLQAQISASSAVISNQVTQRYARAGGMSIWLPFYPSTYNLYFERYRNLQFNQNTNWINAVAAILP